MKRPWVLIALSAVLVAILAAAILAPRAMVSPGELSAAHADLGGDCFACHAPFRGAPSERCVSCHKLADIGLRTTRGLPLPTRPTRPPFHQALSAANCLACHAEHQGAHPPRSSGPTFAHALLQPALRGRCETCHAPPADTLHRQFKAGCAQCHTTRAWTPAAFDHGRYFRLEGEHAAPCATCHVNGDFKRYTCFGCHEHTPAKIRAEHEEEGIRNFDNCVRCHRSGDEEGREGGERREGGRRERERD